ncbi:hypothetical protein PGRAT_27505 [Paenibacillus graminis]|uniref:Uncharacterized protein n=1 Tax=Paenibacillus graminis TaxID=189425 RepID=A0A089MHI6_9BACL|nr:hypothetical protein PGRAT_27505 [Paenibacillus graminis]
MSIIHPPQNDSSHVKNGPGNLRTALSLAGSGLVMVVTGKINWFSVPICTFFVFLKREIRIPLKQRRGRTDCGKATAFALVSGFSPLWGMKKIWRAQRLEQRSVHAASIRRNLLNYRRIKFTLFFQL